jgi:hypothetical protein
MKTMFKSVIQGSLMLTLSCGLVFGQDPATTKAAAAFKTSATVIPPNDGKWHTVLETNINNPSADDDLFIDVSQVNRITTTTVTSSATPNVISSGDASLSMRVLVDGIVAAPGPIVFDEQITQLTSSLQRFLSLSCTTTPSANTIVTTSCVCASTLAGFPQAVSCAPPPAPLPMNTTRTCTTQTSPDPDVVTTCSLVPGANQTLATLLSQTIGHSFDFLAVGVGGHQTHIVQVQEMLTQTTNNLGTAQAVIGSQTLKVQAVNLSPTKGDQGNQGGNQQ